MGKKRKPPMDPRLVRLIMKLKRVRKSLEEDAELPVFRPTTLCDLCDKACGFCEWSEKNARPVPGWEAIRNDILYFNGRENVKIESYAVLDCPKFVPDANGARYEFDKEYARERASKRGVYRGED